jgi:hypothetical protein
MPVMCSARSLIWDADRFEEPAKCCIFLIWIGSAPTRETVSKTGGVMPLIHRGD